MPPGFQLDFDDIDLNESVSMTWSIDENGNMHHAQSGTRVSPNEGILFQGHEYKLSCEDIEFEGGDKTLGAGAGGVVIKGIIKSTGVPVALKTIKVDDQAKRAQLLNELKGLVESAGCPQLVQWYAGFVNKSLSSVHVALEYMDLGSLADLQRRCDGRGVPPEYLSCIARQVMLGLAHLHNKRLLHRDLKPHNILHNSKGEVKLTDFGISRDLDTTFAMAGTFVGTVTYMSPERCVGSDYNLASDVWSVGMVFYELATGKYPFPDVSNFPTLYENLVDKPEPRLDPAIYPEPLCDFVANCLTRDVSKRMETNVLLQHPFVNEGVTSEEQLAAWLQTLAPDP